MPEQNPAVDSVLADLQVLRVLQERLEQYVQHQLPMLQEDPNEKERAEARLKELGPHRWGAPQKLRELVERLEVRAQLERPAQLEQLVRVGELQELVQLVRAAWVVWSSREALALLRRLEQLEGRLEQITQLKMPALSTPDYETDFAAWAEHQAAAIRVGTWEALDQEHLAEELEALSRREHDELESRLEVLTTHLLKWRFDSVSQGPRRLWRATIREQRRRLARLVHRSPSLRPTLPDVLNESYPHARLMAIDETGLPDATLPEVCPWTVTQVLDADFWPEA